MPELPKRELLDPQTPYKTFNSAKSQGRAIDPRSTFSHPREGSLFERINELQKEAYQKEQMTTKKYESVVARLERNLQIETQRRNEARKEYKALAQISMNFQSALKKLQKAVRTKKENVDSYKKNFDEKSKQLSLALLKYKTHSKSKAEPFNQRETFEINSAKQSYGVTPESSANRPRIRSEAKMAPKNLNRVYYDSEANQSDFTNEKLTNEIQRLQKQVENIKLKKKEIVRERDRLQDLCSEKDNIILQLQKAVSGQHEGEHTNTQNDVDKGVEQIYKKRLANADSQIISLKKEITKLEGKIADNQTHAAGLNQDYASSLQAEKEKAEELVDDTQKMIDRNIRNLTSRLSEKEKKLEKITSEVKTKLDALDAHTNSTLKQSYEDKISDLKLKHRKEINDLKTELEELRSTEDHTTKIQSLELKITSLEEQISQKHDEIGSKSEEIGNLKAEIQEKEGVASDLTKKLETHKEDHKNAVDRLNIQLQKALEESKDTEGLRNEKNVLQQQIKDQAEQSRKKEIDLRQEYESLFEEKDNTIEELNKEIEDLKLENVQKLEAQKDDFDTQMKNLRESFESDMKKMKEEFSKTREDLESKNKDLQTKYQTALEDKEETETDLKSQIEKLTQNNSQKLTEVEKQYKTEISTLKSQLEHKSHAYDELSTTLNQERENANNQLDQTEKDLKSKLDQANNDLRNLKEKIRRN